MSIYDPYLSIYSTLVQFSCKFYCYELALLTYIISKVTVILSLIVSQFIDLNTAVCKNKFYEGKLCDSHLFILNLFVLIILFIIFCLLQFSKPFNVRHKATGEIRVQKSSVIGIRNGLWPEFKT